MKQRQVAGVLAAMALASASAAQECKVLNPTGREYKEECVRLSAEPPAGSFAVECDGAEVPYQVEEYGGRKWVWVCVDMAPGAEKKFRIAGGKTPKKSAPKVQMRKDGAVWTIDNGVVAVGVNAGNSAAIPGPIAFVGTSKGKPFGRSFWNTKRRLTGLTPAVIGDGTLFGKIRLRYEFEGKAGVNDDLPAFAEIDVAVYPGQRHAVIQERHEMDMMDCWELDLAAGWKPEHAVCEPHSGGFGRPDLGPWPPNTLKTGQTRMGDTLLNLLPRWSQAYDDGWFFLTHDGKDAAGALVVGAGRWEWPHDNCVAVKVKDSGDYAGLRCPTWRGRRYWFLLAGPKETWTAAASAEPKARSAAPVNDYVARHGFEPLDKLNNDYDLDWPGGPGKFRGDFFFSNSINPTGGIRGRGKGAIANAGKRPGDYGTWTNVQVMFDPDMYGTYWLFWSPENPNFFTDFVKVPIGEGTNLKAGPRFKERIARIAELRFHEDVHHSVTLPGGAGNECPGYSRYAVGHYREIAAMCKEQYGFDAMAWPQLKAAGSFQAHVSQPDGVGARASHPGGDTHPHRFDPLAFAEELGVTVEPETWKTEELPGFGAVLRNNCFKADETYFAFKSGPNRGHYHGDQLSFHLCFGAKAVAVDHHCSYAPRAGQEHMHNRVAFSDAADDRFKYANMDGYERLIALKTGDAADVAMGQVESPRIRAVKQLPPEDWDSEYPQKWFEKPLKYRRTVVLMKGAGGSRDYFVIRDQYAGPKLSAAFCMHVYGERCERKGNVVLAEGLTVTVAAPREFAFENLPWQHANGGVEKTQGLRLSVTGEAAEFVTVVCPGGEPPAATAVAGGVKVGGDEVTFAGGIDDDGTAACVTVKRDGKVVATVTGRDVDLRRSQGEVGLFVPDAGYPFGPIPNWLIRQRNKVPDWARQYVDELRRR